MERLIELMETAESAADYEELVKLFEELTSGREKK